LGIGSAVGKGRQRRRDPGYCSMKSHAATTDPYRTHHPAHTPPAPACPRIRTTGDTTMPMIRMRISGDHDKLDTLINAIRGIDGIEHVEDVDEESMDEMRDDSSSSELVDDNQGDVVRVEIEAPQKKVELVRNVALLASRELDIAVEFVDEF
jgi:hypothetical protein